MFGNAETYLIYRASDVRILLIYKKKMKFILFKNKVMISAYIIVRNTRSYPKRHKANPEIEQSDITRYYINHLPVLVAHIVHIVHIVECTGCNLDNIERPQQLELFVGKMLAMLHNIVDIADTVEDIVVLV